MREFLLKLFEGKDFVDEDKAKEILGSDYKNILNSLVKAGLVRVDVSSESCSDFPKVYYFLTSKGKSLMKAESNSK